ncbi:hypothetical protein PFISCL1PPCAC_14523 [Pristionchus fissidentatus]|uniref:Nuclear receptor domain-containing protein n=1 Tax=Pristionchus fissidentatus TaxID=1538716 RepID=A0AAV5VXH3_9BILA|nr:hypothetical protein PFISCL1PPCAC_14523 [Pristionchus fissidentatus]
MPSTVKLSEADHRSCLVCSAPTNVVHLGMDICRACSCFFTRAKKTGKEYPCRQGNGTCDTAKEAKYVCRRCRFDKCISVGLTYNGPMRERRKAVVPILNRIRREFNISVERRRVQEWQLLRKCGLHKRIPHPTLEIYDVQETTFYEILNIYVVQSFVFFKKSFPALQQLPEKETEIIFKDFIGKLSIIESYYFTRQIWGGINRFIMNSVFTCKDMDNSLGIDGIDSSKVYNADLLKSCTQMHVDDLHRVLLPIFNRTNLSETEFFALITLAMCELDAECEISEEAKNTLDKYRLEALKGLQSFYRQELGLVDYSMRIGNLMSLNHVIQECKSLFTVFLRLYDTMFDLFMGNDLMRRMFL